MRHPITCCSLSILNILMLGTDAREWIVNSNASYSRAVDNISIGDTITMLEGEYSGQMCCPKVISVPNVTIRAKKAYTVVIDCNSSSQHLVVNAPNFKFFGISLMNGFSEDAGGCVLVNASQSLYENGKLENCVTYGTGGGMMLTSHATRVTFINMEITQSSAANGGAAYVNGALEIRQSLAVSDNAASNFGGGLFLNSGSAASFDGAAQFANNTASIRGGAVYAIAASIDISGNVTFVGNAATDFTRSTAGGAVFAKLGTSVVAGPGSAVAFRDNSCAYEGGAAALITGSTWLTGGTTLLAGDLMILRALTEMIIQKYNHYTMIIQKYNHYALLLRALHCNIMYCAATRINDMINNVSKL